MGAAIRHDVLPRRRKRPRTTVDAICVHCHTVLYERDALCGDCGGKRPGAGWRSLATVPDAWLGQIVLEHLLVTRRVGSGSTATVYRAQSLESPQRFALKIIDLERPGSSHEENLANAHREVEIASRLTNPHIVRIYDMRAMSDRHVGVVMDFVDGKDLRTIVNAEGPLHPARAIGLVRQLANGLHEAHQAGIVHRDVKPENLLIQTLPGGEDFLRISDFGIASPTTSLENEQGFIGTPLWASPEQILGQRVDARSDIYSIGGLLYFLLTGQAPFNRGNYMTILKSHLNVAAPQLRDAGTRLFSSALEELVAMLLRKDREERPADLLELLAILDEVERTPGWSDYVDIAPPAIGLMEDSETIEQFGSIAKPRGLCMEEFELSVASIDSDLAVMRDGRVALAGRALELITLSPRNSFTLKTDTDSASAIELTEEAILLGDADGTVRRVHNSGREAVFYRSADGRAIVDIAADPDEHVIAVGTKGGVLHIRYAHDRGGVSHTLRGAPVTALAVDRDGRRLAVARRNGSVEIRDTATPDDVEHRIDVDGVASMAISGDGHMLGVLKQDGTIEVWAIDTGSRVFQTRRREGEIVGLQFGAQGLLGLCRDEERCYVVDLQCENGDRCTPDCLHCHLHA